MTDISCGGGPSLSQRRAFSGLKTGTHVPGYGGYCPQLKYRVGKTYGNDTQELSEQWHHRHPSAPAPPVSARPPLANPLPKSTGDNKYTEKMVPGYTGYVPRMTFKFGGTYKDDCDVCIDEHLTNSKHHNDKAYELRRSTRAFPTLNATQFDPTVRDHLNTYRDTRPGRTLTGDQRGSTEPPMPGYQGYVPRIRTTELGLGCRYHQMCHNGLDAFQSEQEHHRAMQRAPVNIHRMPGAVSATAVLYNKRLYENDGMVPKYTGYVPQRRYHFGDTYGNTTRSLDVCSHEKTCYGEFVRSRPRNMYASLA